MKKMKYIILVLFAIAFTATSCDSFLDITPDGQAKRDPLLETEQGIEDALYGVYSQMRSTTLYGQELYFSALEVMAHNLYCQNNTLTTALGQFDYENTNVKSLFASIWTSMYKNISNVNSVLNAPKIVNAKEYPFTIYRGEALGLRAFMHFDLVRLFAEQYTVNPAADGIPYATEFSLKTPEFESLKENYKHIIEDLLEADSLLAGEDEYENERAFMLDRQIHFNRLAVRATLARVYLTMGDKVNAVKYAQDVINDGRYMLKDKTEVLNDIAGVLSKKECIFGIYHPNFYKQVFEKLQQRTTRYSLDLRNDYLAIYDKDNSGLDFRTTAYFTTVSGGTENIDRLSKLTEIYEYQNNVALRPADLILGINMIRIPEMYYIVAEVLLDSDYETALGYYNTVREHRGLNKLGDDVVLTMEKINDERYKEYIGEGLLFFNKKRLNQSIVPYDGVGEYKPEDGIYVIPIPDSETENRY